jgi:hypothetical protein
MFLFILIYEKRFLGTSFADFYLPKPKSPLGFSNNNKLCPVNILMRLTNKRISRTFIIFTTKNLRNE